AREHPRGRRPGYQTREKVAESNMPRPKHVNLLHHRVREFRRRCEPRQFVQYGGQLLQRFEVRTTARAFADVGFQRYYAEANVAVEQKVELVGEKMSVVHG